MVLQRLAHSYGTQILLCNLFTCMLNPSQGCLETPVNAVQGVTPMDYAVLGDHPAAVVKFLLDKVQDEEVLKHLVFARCSCMPHGCTASPTCALPCLDGSQQ